MWKVRRSKIHGTGVFSTQDIKKEVKIIEYIGEKILRSEGDKRSERRLKKYLNSNKEGSVYIFELNSRYDIDGTFKYNKARYINHSCNPNCEVRIEKGKIWIYSIKNIKKGDELSYDYGYDFDPEDYTDHICKCGARNCVGYIISSEDIPKLKSLIKKKAKNKNGK